MLLQLDRPYFVDTQGGMPNFEQKQRRNGLLGGWEVEVGNGKRGEKGNCGQSV